MYDSNRSKQRIKTAKQSLHRPGIELSYVSRSNIDNCTELLTPGLNLGKVELYHLTIDAWRGSSINLIGAIRDNCSYARYIYVISHTYSVRFSVF